jgi:hypothetical protein
MPDRSGTTVGAATYKPRALRSVNGSGQNRRSHPTSNGESDSVQTATSSSSHGPVATRAPWTARLSAASRSQGDGSPGPAC